MQNRIFEIDNLLKELSALGDISSEQINNYLLYYKLEAPNYEEFNIKSICDKLLKKYRKKIGKSIDYENGDNYSVFKNSNIDNGIKLYINFGIDNIESSIIKIFDYINKNNIEYLIKIDSYVNTDSLVISVNDKESAKKVVGFVNKKFEDNTRGATPFLSRIGEVSIGYADEINYTNFVARILSSYFKNRELSKVCYGDFISYVDELNGESIDELLMILSIDKEYISNIKYNLNLLQISLKDNQDIDDILDNIINIEKISIDKPLEPVIKKVPKEQLLINYINYCLDKYGINQTKAQIKEFYNGTRSDIEDKYLLITKDNNFRDCFRSNDMINQIHDIINSNSLDEYIEKITNKTDYSIITSLLDEYILYSINYSNKNTTINLLNAFINSKDYNIIDDNFKQKFINLDVANKIMYIVEDNIESYINELENNTNILKK